MAVSPHRTTRSPAKCLLPLSLLLVSACGFQLRGGAGAPAAQWGGVHISALGAEEWGETLRAELERSGAVLHDGVEQAEWRVRLSEERLARDPVSVSAATGKAEEYRLTLSGAFSVQDRRGQTLIGDETVQAEREYTYAEQAALSASSEEAAIRADLRRRLSQAVMRRLQRLAAEQRGN